jgi:nitrite reductase (NADH) small subunit
MIHKGCWIRAVRCGDVPPREGRSVQLAGREIAIFNLGERFLAIDNRCPHKQGPLAEGIVAGETVVCPLHAWKVNLETGAVTRPAAEAACVQSHPVRVIDGIIQVCLPPHSADHRQYSVSCAEENPPEPWAIGAGSIGELTP